MKYCVEPISRWLVRIFFYMAVYLVASFTFDLIKHLWNDNTADAFFSGFCILLMGCICGVTANLSAWINRKYQLLPEGLLVAYPGRKPRMIPWRDITEVAVCRVHRIENRSNGDMGLRVAIGDTFAHGDNLRGLWQDISFSIKYREYVIVFDYDEELEAEFAKVCPIPILKLPT